MCPRQKSAALMCAFSHSYSIGLRSSKDAITIRTCGTLHAPHSQISFKEFCDVMGGDDPEPPEVVADAIFDLVDKVLLH